MYRVSIFFSVYTRHIYTEYMCLFICWDKIKLSKKVCVFNTPLSRYGSKYWSIPIRYDRYRVRMEVFE